MIDVDALQTRIDTNPAVIAHAIDVIERGAKYPLTLQAIKDASEFDGSTTAAFLVELLEKEDKVEAFARQARMLFSEVLTVAPELNPHNDPNFATFRGDDTNVGATAAELGRFLIEAGSWSCRVFRDGEFAGSGLLVSPRLVLTAHHVCINATRELGKLSVEAGADARFRHRAAAYEQFHSPCHPEEWSGANPSADELEGHNDLALLWLDEPLGTQFGFYRVPETDIHLDGRVDCVVFHHPPTKNIDMSFGHIEVRPNKFERFPCSYGGTEPGSSGGAVFTNRQILIGHHQGRWREGLPELRRMVPLSYSRIVPTPNDPAQATDPDMPVKPEFLKTILDDRQPPSIWSLNSKLDGHLVIGRERFFASISNILSGRFPRIRGIHVIGDDQTDETSGESFSFSLLDSYLNAHEQTHVSAVRIPISSSDDDLFSMIALRLNLDQGELELADGVRPGQTTPEAIDRERAKQLVAKIECYERLGRVMPRHGATRQALCIGSHEVTHSIHSRRIGFSGVLFKRWMGPASWPDPVPPSAC
ncbi:MAG: trypsin-like peptidase domain-containing protein [Pseudomonadota bacterium]